MEIHFDEMRGIIRSTVKGVQSTADSAAYIAALIEAIEIARARVGHVYHLVDGREAAVQPTATTDVYAGFATMGGIGVDRVAVILSSALLKMQTQRIYRDMALALAIFDDPGAALAWLTRPPETPA